VQRIVYADNEANYCPTCQTEAAVGRPLAVAAAQGSWPKTLEELEERKKTQAVRSALSAVRLGRKRFPSVRANLLGPHFRVHEEETCRVVVGTALAAAAEERFHVREGR